MGRSTSMPTADRTAERIAWTCFRGRAWRRRPESTSAPTKRSTMCALRIRAAWTTSRRPPSESGALRAASAVSRARRLLRLLPEGFQPRFLGEHLVGVLRGRLVERAAVHLQRGLGVAQAALILAQDLAADHYVDVPVEQRLLPAVVRQLLEAILRQR